MSESSNLRIWGAVEKTDPKRTKQYKGKGGFQGTAINSTYQARQATEMFGPMGVGWGVDVTELDYRNGAPFAVNESVTGCEITCIAHVTLWYIDPETSERASVSHYGVSAFVGQNKYGAFTDEQAPKKARTDGMSKCLAQLGFSADVHMGLYDDHEYLAELAGGEKADAQALTKMAAVFSARGVTLDDLAAHLGHPVWETTAGELPALLEAYRAIEKDPSNAGEALAALHEGLANGKAQTSEGSLDALAPI